MSVFILFCMGRSGVGRGVYAVVRMSSADLETSSFHVFTQNEGLPALP